MFIFAFKPLIFLTPICCTAMKIKCSIQKYLSIENVVLFFIFLFLISYTAIRMYNIPLTHDECVSYQQYSVHSTFQIITYTKVSTIPNNHILNTLFIKAINTLSFGSATWLLRFHIWLSYIMLFIFSVLIVKEMNIRWLVVPAVVLLNFNPYMLEFFSLARGYGLAISCMLGSMYYFVR